MDAPSAAQPTSTAIAALRYEKDGGAGGVLSLIQKIIAESVTLEKEALHAEQTSQSDYERFVSDSARFQSALGYVGHFRVLYGI